MKIKEFEECFAGMLTFTERAMERLKKNDARLKDAESQLDAENVMPTLPGLKRHRQNIPFPSMNMPP